MISSALNLFKYNRLKLINSSRPLTCAVSTNYQDNNDYRNIYNNINRKELSSQNSAAQAMLIGSGINYENLQNPLVGVCSTWMSGNPCNLHINDLAKNVEFKLKELNLNPRLFNVTGISDGISMGTSGMKYSLPSREIIADAIELHVNGMSYDSLITIPGCDKNIPGCIMGMLRVNKPGLLIYGGSIRPGKDMYNNKIDIVTAFESYSRYKNGDISNKERIDIIKNACPGAGACGGMYTANTMAVISEVMGLSLPYSSSNPAISFEKNVECYKSANSIKNLMINNILPRDIVTKEAIINGITMGIAMGGSTNLVIHLLAIANESNIDLSLDDIENISKKTPVIANMKPFGEYLMYDIYKIGGIPRIIKYLVKEGLINGNILTVTCNTLSENLNNIDCISKTKSNIICNIEKPYLNRGHIRILKGNLSPNGCVGKITSVDSKNELYFKGPALVCESENEFMKLFNNDLIKKGMVVVIRNVGPKGGPGMKEMLKPTSAISGSDLDKKVALITDGRFSGGSHGIIIGHICPEYSENGNIKLVKNGDLIEICTKKKEINLLISKADLNKRKHISVNNKNNNKSENTHNKFLERYKNSVSLSSKGCILN